MESKRCSIIFVMSRKGGVGKSSIGLSSLVQLVAEGKKVAYLDLDTQGTHLSQVVPLTGHVDTDGDKYLFSPEKFLDAKWYNWALTRKAPYGNNIERLEQAEATMHIPATVQSNILRHFEADLDAVTQAISRLESAEYCRMLLCSPYANDITDTNQFFLSTDGQRRFRQTVSSYADHLEQDGFDYLIVDNSPGLSFNPSSCITWAAEESHVRQTSIWTVANYPWWEIGHTLYEFSYFKKALARVDLSLVVNRAEAVLEGTDNESSWESIPAGKLFKLNYDDTDGSIDNVQKELLARILGVPVWMVTHASVVRKSPQHLLPGSSSHFATIRSDETFQNVLRFSSSTRIPMPLENAYDINERRFQDYLHRDWGARSANFMEGFLAGALGGCFRGAKKTFHTDIADTLLSSLKNT